MFKRCLVLILTLVFTVSFCACGGDDGDNSSVVVDPNDPFTGDWLYVTEDGIHEYLYLLGNGQGCQQILDIYIDIGYEYTEDTLTISAYVDDPPHVNTYKYKLEGNDLFLENVETGLKKHFVKQKSE